MNKNRQAKIFLSEQNIKQNHSVKMVTKENFPIKKELHRARITSKFKKFFSDRGSNNFNLNFSLPGSYECCSCFPKSILILFYSMFLFEVESFQVIFYTAADLRVNEANL